MKSHVSLIQGYYHFLYLGKFLEQVIKVNDLSPLAQDISLETSGSSSFVLKGKTIESLLKEIHLHPEKKNVFGYLTEISAFRGIFGGMRELIENDVAFRSFLKKTLKDQYFPFEQLIRFLRNVMTHTNTSSLELSIEDFQKQEAFVKYKGEDKIILDFLYSKYLLERSGSKEYGVKASLDFSTLKVGVSLWNVISLHQCYLLSELCYNLTKVFGQRSAKKVVSHKREIKVDGKNPGKTVASSSVVGPSPKRRIRYKKVKK